MTSIKNRQRKTKHQNHISSIIASLNQSNKTVAMETRLVQNCQSVKLKIKHI